jgi:hypothetical protein
MTSTTLFSLPTLLNAAQLWTTSFTSPNETRKERNMIKLKLLGHPEMQNM